MFFTKLPGNTQGNYMAKCKHCGADISMLISRSQSSTILERKHIMYPPAMSKLAKRYLSVLASSGPVERLFSIAGKIFRPERCRLTDTVFENLMFIKCNSYILDLH